jgi:hypothetical protein
LAQLSGKSTIFLTFDCSRILIKFSKLYHLSVHHKNIVSKSFLNVFIASIVLSGVVEIASSIKVIQQNVHKF